MHAQPPIDARLRSTSELVDYLSACLAVGEVDLVQECLAHVPAWATFRDVESALRDAGLGFKVSECNTRSQATAPGRFWRRATDRRRRN